MNITRKWKTIFMTGAIGAIAEAVVKTLHSAGARPVLKDKKPAGKALALHDSYGIANFSQLEMDVMDPERVEAVVNRAFRESGTIDIALGHAGGNGIFPFTECPHDRFDAIFAFNFAGQTYVARSILKEWMERKIAGHLMFISTPMTCIAPGWTGFLLLGKAMPTKGIANVFLYLSSELGSEMAGHILQVTRGVGLPKLG